MNPRLLSRGSRFFVVLFATALISFALSGQDAHFHNAPASSAEQKNPYAGQNAAATAGAALYATYCGSCHGVTGQGTGNIPPLSEGPTQTAPEGEVFWFITTGSVNNGMPAWGMLSEQQRWEIVGYLKSLKTSPGEPTNPAGLARVTPAATNAPPPEPPFTDFRYEEPGKVRKIEPQNLPAPYATDTSSNGPKVVARPNDAWPKAPAGFTVEQYATGLDNPRFILTAPNGDIFLAESSSGKIKLFRGTTREGKPNETNVFATGLNRPYGIAFYPPGDNPQWVYIGNTDSVIRFPYLNGDLTARGPSQHIVDLPHGGSHWTRDIQFSPDGKHMSPLKIRLTAEVSLAAGMGFSAFDTSSILKPSQNHSFLGLSHRAETW